MMMINMENPDSISTLNINCGLHGEVNQNDSRKNGLRLGNDMSQSVCLFRKYLLERTQHNNIGKTNKEESEAITSLPSKFIRKSLLRSPSLLERKLLPELRRDSMKSTMSFAEKSSNTAQLTIFYDGGVNVYDNVSAEKVQEIMLILHGQSSTSTSNIRAPPCYSQSVRKSRAGPLLARKYSLQCFLEKRRDRMISKSPYGSPSSVTENIDKEAKREKTELNLKGNSLSSISPFPSRLGYCFPVSANKGC